MKKMRNVWGTEREREQEFVKVCEKENLKKFWGHREGVRERETTEKGDLQRW